MRSTLRLYFSSHYWLHQFEFGAFAKSVFSVIGLIASGIAAWKKLSEAINPGATEVADFLVAHYGCIAGAMLVVSIFVALYLLKPITKVSVRVKKRELTVSIEVGDVFDTNDALVIGTNCTFDTDPAGGLISPNSLQAQFTTRYFNDHHTLDAVLEQKLASESFEQLTKNVKAIGKRKQYVMGTTVKLDTKERTAFLVTNARMNGHGVAHSSTEDLLTSFAGLWEFITERGGGLPHLRVPVMGTGMAKVNATRPEVVRHMLRSFFAACSAQKFCESLAIVISVKDYVEHEIDLRELGQFLKFLEAYTDFKSVSDAGQGVGLSI